MTAARQRGQEIQVQTPPRLGENLLAGRGDFPTSVGVNGVTGHRLLARGGALSYKMSRNGLQAFVLVEGTKNTI